MPEKTLSITARRTFLVLQSLIEQPCSQDELLAVLAEKDPDGDVLSRDTLGLYINTLRQCGCQIKRPSRQNGFRYVLTHHPFLQHYTHAHLQALAFLRPYLEQVLVADSLLQWDALLNKLLEAAWIENVPCPPGFYYQQCRTVAYQQQANTIATLQQALAAQTLVQVDYQPDGGALRTLHLLPTELLFEHGALYTVGLSQDHSEPLFLRVDRMQGIQAVPEEHGRELRQYLLEQNRRHQTVVLVFPQQDMETVLQQLHQHWPHSNPTQWQLEDRLQDCCLTLQTRQLFRLRQALLQSGLPVQVQAPEPFARLWQQELLRTRQRYAQPHHHPSPVGGSSP